MDLTEGSTLVAQNLQRKKPLCSDLSMSVGYIWRKKHFEELSAGTDYICNEECTGTEYVVGTDPTPLIDLLNMK